MRNPIPENGAIPRASAILQALKEGPASSLRLTEIALRCGLEKSTTHRLLAALIAEGLVEQESDSERYRLGLRLLELGMAVLKRMDLRDEALPIVRALAQRAGDTVHLGIASGSDVVYLDKVESPHAFQMRSRVGERMPLHSTAIGKCILAYQRDDELEVLVAAGLEQRTPHTIIAPDKLRDELQRIRLRGYSTDMEENEEGVRCVAAPVFDHNQGVVGGVSISGPVFRFTGDRMTELSVHVVSAAQALSLRLGCTASPYAVLR